MLWLHLRWLQHALELLVSQIRCPKSLLQLAVHNLESAFVFAAYGWKSVAVKLHFLVELQFFTWDIAFWIIYKNLFCNPYKYRTLSRFSDHLQNGIVYVRPPCPDVTVSRSDESENRIYKYEHNRECDICENASKTGPSHLLKYCLINILINYLYYLKIINIIKNININTGMRNKK